MRCPHCDQEHPDNTKFCPETGNKLELQSHLCNNPNCDFRQPLPLTANFCPNCGKELFESNDMEDTTPMNDLYALAYNYIDYNPVYIINAYGNRIKDIGDDISIDLNSFFSDGLACVSLKSTGKTGYININGDFVILPFFEWGTPFSEGLALVCDGDKKKYINTAGETIFEEFGDVRFMTEFVNGIAIFEDAKTSLRGFLNKQGEIIIKPQFGDCSLFNTGIAQVRYIDSFNTYYIDTKGNFINRYNQIQFHSSPYSDGFASFHRRKKFGYIDISMKITIEPRFYKAHPFSQGLAAVNEDGYYKFIDQHGKVVIDKYDKVFPNKGIKIEEVSEFRNGLVVFGIEIVRNDFYPTNIYGVMNLYGEVLCAPKYDFITDFGF